MAPDETDQDVFGGQVGPADSVEDGDWVVLPSAELLDVPGADELLRWRAANLVAVVGERNSGKTTLITELYERYLRGAFAGHIFAHSRTLVGFERKTFESRLASERIVPDTLRTSERDGLLFFHLGLVSDDGEMRRSDLLISERAGETYRKARDRPETSQELSELRRANRVAFLLDGERVAAGRTRAEVFASVRGMIRAFSESSAISPTAEIQLVTTKVDLLSAEANIAAVSALEQFEHAISSAYGSETRAVTTWRTAARDPSGSIEAAFGVGPLLENWVASARLEVSPTIRMPQLQNEFDLLLTRRAPA